jgi:serine/threonine protein kinase
LSSNVPQPTRSTFGKYVLLRKLASGGMGEIFLAKQRGPSGFEKLLVIKRILSHHLDKKDYLDMFFSEAKLVARLNHNNIIQIQEMGEIDGDYYIAMEYVRGKSLRDLIDELRAEGRKLPLPHVIDLAMKLCDGLGYAHQARDIRGRGMNIVHRDINPHNILISYTGDLKLIDFGIAKSEMTSVHTATGTIKGKFVYMSPEQSAADPIDRRSDIFSLGIVLYEMTCLENPFVRQNVVLSLEAIQRHDVTAPSSKRPDAGPMDEILMKALAKKPDERFQTAIEMRDELRSLFRSGSVTPAEEDLSTFLHDLFRADIEEEDRLLAEADQATAGEEGAVPVAAPVVIEPLSVQQPHTPQPITTQPFADEEPTLAGDLDDIAAKSREVSQVSGEMVRAVTPSGGMIPDFDTRSDRVPRSSGDVSASLEIGPDGLPLPGAISPGLMASLAPRDDRPHPPAPLLPMDRRMPDEEPKLGSGPRSIEDLPRAAAFSEPLAGLNPTREMRSGESLLDQAPRTPPRPLQQYTTDEDSPGSLVEPPPPWKRVLRLAIYLLVLVITTVAGFMATRAVIGNKGTDHAPIAPIPDEPIITPDIQADPIRPDPPSTVEPVLGQPADEVVEIVEPPPLAPPPRAAATDLEPSKRKNDREKKKKKKKKDRDLRVKDPKPEPPDEPEPEKEPERKPERKVEAPPPPKPAPEEEPKQEPKPERRVVAPAEPPSEKGEKLGTLTIRTSVGVKVEVDGRTVGSTPASVAVSRDKGRIKLFGDAVAYSVVLAYEVSGDGVTVKVEASPWAIVQHNGLSLGRTPQGPVPSGRRHRFSLLRPGEEGPFVVSLLWNPK